MYQFDVLFRCLSVALLRNGLKAMALSVPLGPTLYEIAESTLEEYRRRVNDANAEARLRAELEALAQARAENVRPAAVEAVRAEAASQPAQVQADMIDFLCLVPQVVRQSLRCRADPSGCTVPGHLPLRRAEDLLRFLPDRMPHFKPGDRPLAGILASCVEPDAEPRLGHAGILTNNLRAHLEPPAPPPPPPLPVLLHEQRRPVSPPVARPASRPDPKPEERRSVSPGVIISVVMVLAVLGIPLLLVFAWPRGDKDSGNGVTPSPSSVAAGPSFTNTFGMKMVRIPGGIFWMGGGAGKPGDNQETIPHDFYLGTTEVTQGQWVAVTGGANPSKFSRDGENKNHVKDFLDADLAQFPVESVSWDMIQKDFLPKLNAREANSEWKYRLPTEAEWEYSCRGGATSQQDSAFDFYLDRGPTNDLSSADANFDGTNPAGKADKGTDLNRPCRVGSYKPNKLGLYDMHGNVWEWCEDLFESGPSWVFRGGGWCDSGSDCAAGSRFRFVPSFRCSSLGFRVARVPVR